jgi:hypothetical protein
METDNLARWLILGGLIVAGLGGVLWLAGRLGLPLGRLPGDLRFETGGVSCFVPLATSVLLSLALTLIINLLARWRGP